MRPSYLYKGNSYTGKLESSYWNPPKKNNTISMALQSQFMCIFYHKNACKIV